MPARMKVLMASRIGVTAASYHLSRSNPRGHRWLPPTATESWSREEKYAIFGKGSMKNAHLPKVNLDFPYAHYINYFILKNIIPGLQVYNVDGRLVGRATD